MAEGDFEQCLIEILCALGQAGRAQLFALLDDAAQVLQAQVDVLTAQAAVLQIPNAAAQSAFDVAQAALDNALAPLSFLPVTAGAGCADFGRFTTALRDALYITTIQEGLDKARDEVARTLDVLDEINRLILKYTTFIDDVEVLKEAITFAVCDDGGL